MRVRTCACLRVRYCSRACGIVRACPFHRLPCGVLCAVRCCATAAVLCHCCHCYHWTRLRWPALCCCVSVGGRGAIYLFSCPALSCLLSACCCCLRSLAPAPPAHRVAVCVLCNTLILAIRSRSLIRYSVSHSFRSALRYRTACCVAYAAYRYCYTQQLLSFTH